MTVTRSFPVGSLMKVKKFSEHVHVQNGIDIPGYLQLRSSTMQVLYFSRKFYKLLSYHYLSRKGLKEIFFCLTGSVFCFETALK